MLKTNMKTTEKIKFPAFGVHKDSTFELAVLFSEDGQRGIVVHAGPKCNRKVGEFVHLNNVDSFEFKEGFAVSIRNAL